MAKIKKDEFTVPGEEIVSIEPVGVVGGVEDKAALPEQPLLDAGCWISEAPGWWRNTAAFTYKNALGQWTAPSTSAMPLADALEVESKRPK